MSVRVWRIDRAAVIDRLRTWARRLASDHPEVLAVVLFGSLARGEATASSDADVLLLLADSPLPFAERLVRWKPAGLGIGVEVFPYTVSEARDAVSAGWGVVAAAFRDGLPLYERDGAWDALKR